MAEAIEINFPTESDKNPKIDSELKNQILGFNVKESMDQDKDCLLYTSDAADE